MSRLETHFGPVIEVFDVESSSEKRVVIGYRTARLSSSAPSLTYTTSTPSTPPANTSNTSPPSTSLASLIDREGKPYFKHIVEGANLFLTQQARLYIEKHGVVLFKDA